MLLRAESVLINKRDFSSVTLLWLKLFAALLSSWLF
jgi:hypothetical protein